MTDSSPRVAVPGRDLRRVAILMGGISPEHPVSLASGCGVFANIDRTRYEPFPVLISRAGVWIWPGGPAAFPETLTVAEAEAWIDNPPEGWVKAALGNMLRIPQAEVFFIALHGVGGEDGTLQEYLEAMGQPFTGSGAAASRAAMDKIRSKELYRAHGIPTAPWLVLPHGTSGTAAADRVERELGLPAVVKHPTGGSSIGVAVVKTRGELEKALAEIGAEAPELLVEAFVAGREATCGVLEGARVALPPTEIRPKRDGFFSFEEKYTQNGADEITPAEFPPEVNDAIRRFAAKAHAALGLSVYSRTDFIWTGGHPENGGLFALETNNLPGMTPKSILPQQAAAIGMTYTELVTHVIERSLAEA